MATERGTGHLLSKKRGPAGQATSAYGGSLSLTGASVKNHHMSRMLHLETGQMNREWEVTVKTNYGRRLSLQKQLEQLQLAKQTTTYLDGHSRGHPVHQWDSYTCKKMVRDKPRLSSDNRPTGRLGESGRPSRPKNVQKKGTPQRNSQKSGLLHREMTDLPECVGTTKKLSTKYTHYNCSARKDTTGAGSIETDSQKSDSTNVTDKV